MRLGLGDTARARELLDRAGDAPAFAPFYVARSQAFKDVAPERSLADLRRAETIDPGQWRIGRLLVERYLDARDYDQALVAARRTHLAAPENYIAGMVYARALVRSRRFEEATELLDRLNVLPYEGATEGRRLYREAYLMRALEAMRGAQAGRALDLVARARQWPEHLGAGKPYPEDVDERLEDFLQAQALKRLGNTAEARRLLDELASNGRAGMGAGALVAALAAREVGRDDRAEALVDAWQSGRREDSAAWARGVLAGRRAPLPEALAPDEAFRVLAAWLEYTSGSGLYS